MKKIFAIIAVLALAAFFAGCQKQEAAAPAATAPTTTMSAPTATAAAPATK